MAATARMPSLAALLGAIFLFSTNVLAASAVLGVDLGTEYIKAALVKPGIPLEIVLTKDSRRKETSAVAFKPAKGGAKAGQFPERAYGADAIALAARFPGEVYPNLKTLLGLPVGDPIVADYSARHPALQLETHAGRGTAAFKSNTLTADEEAWLVEELLAMELQSIQKNAELTAGSGSIVRSVVLTVPPFYTTEERRAVQLAADLANLKVLSLISDGMAVGLNYATSRQFPNINEGAKPEYHLVFDMGAGSTTASVLKFQSRTVKDVGKYNKTVQEVQSLGSGWDRTLGGDALNYLIMDDMVSQFVASKGAQKISATSEGVRAHGRAMAKIIKEAERVRHVLSANQNTQASFEGLYEDVDFKYKITRAEFEKMAEAHVERVGAVIADALKMAGLDTADLDSVILHGGASRTPFVQKALEKAVGSADKLRSNVNSDEAAVFGAGFRAAELSPSFRVKEIRIAEGSLYPAGIKWTGSNGKAQRQRLWTAISPIGAAPKELTFNDRTDFSGSFFQQVGDDDKEVAKFATKNLTATIAALKEKYPTCVESEIQFKVGIKLNGDNGEVNIANAHVECEAEVKEGFVDGVKNLFGFGKKDKEDGDADETDEKTDKKDDKKTDKKGSKKADKKSEKKADKKAKSSSSASKDSSSTEEAKPEASSSEEEAKVETKKTEIVSINVEIEVEKSGLPQLTKDETVKSKDRLKAFAASDRSRQQREEALNQLEAFTYRVRDLLDNEDFIAHSTEAERKVLGEKSSEASDWLYEDGAEAAKDEFKAKLKVLQELVAPIQKRIDEDEKRPASLTKLKEALDQTNNFVQNIDKQISEYEEWKAKQPETTSSTSTTTTTEEAVEETPGEFDGLEDDEDSGKSKEKKEAKAEEEEAPIDPKSIPPVFKREDLEQITKLHKETTEWLKDQETKQDKLSATADPVLLSADIDGKRQALEKLSMDLALKSMQGMKKFTEKLGGGKGKKGEKTKKTKKTKGGKGSKGNDKVVMSDEDLDELLDDILKKEEAKAQEKGEEKGNEEELKHDEL